MMLESPAEKPATESVTWICFSPCFCYLKSSAWGAAPAAEGGGEMRRMRAGGVGGWEVEESVTPEPSRFPRGLAFTLGPGTSGSPSVWETPQP